MKLEELKITITRLEDGLDNDGNTFLKAKGYNVYGKGRRKNYNFFTTIKLYPVSQEQMDETKNRLFSQKDAKPKLQIVGYDNDLTTHVKNGTLFVVLVCNKYDFVQDKLFRKNNLVKKENKKCKK